MTAPQYGAETLTMLMTALGTVLWSKLYKARAEDIGKEDSLSISMPYKGVAL